MRLDGTSAGRASDLFARTVRKCTRNKRLLYKSLARAMRRTRRPFRSCAVCLQVFGGEFHGTVDSQNHGRNGGNDRSIRSRRCCRQEESSEVEFALGERTIAPIISIYNRANDTRRHDSARKRSEAALSSADMNPGMWRARKTRRSKLQPRDVRLELDK